VHGREAFAEFLKPRLMELLRAIGLDVVYERAEGDTLHYRDANGREHSAGREGVDGLVDHGRDRGSIESPVSASAGMTSFIPPANRNTSASNP